jgi:hypothetical protein
MFDITTLAATDTSTVELVGGDDAPKAGRCDRRNAQACANYEV